MIRGMARGGAFTAAALAAVIALASTAAAAPEMSGYDGSLPFDCVVQQVGTGTDFPDPGADPFCVEYDKRHQNVTQLGVVEFLAQEPARVAAASDKCWYFQRDHWTGSIVQGDGRTQTYNWDGSYFFDKARGLGGVFVENFTINGQTGDPRELPGFPEEWKPYFGPGKGGVQTSDSGRADPRCVAKAKEAPAPGPYRCSDVSGAVRDGIGPLRLGLARADVEAALGPAARTTGSVSRWCTADGGKLSAAFSRDRVSFALTTSPAFSVKRATPGKSSTKARRTYRKLAQRGGVAVLGARSGRRLLLIGVDRKRVRWLAVAGPRASKRSVNRWLDAAR